jgi:hypothetical protein
MYLALGHLLLGASLNLDELIGDHGIHNIGVVFTN